MALASFLRHPASGGTRTEANLACRPTRWALRAGIVRDTRSAAIRAHVASMLRAAERAFRGPAAETTAPAPRSAEWRWKYALLPARAAFAYIVLGADLTSLPVPICLLGVVTWDTLRERLRAGRGQGYDDDFLPWMWVRRKNVSGKGNQVVDPLPGRRRASHFFARVEWHVALLCIYLGAIDVREQYPLWPWPHQSPLKGYLPAAGQKLSNSRGLLQLARDIGIDHGWEVGSDAPYVASLDIAATTKLRSGYVVSGIALKPHELILTDEPAERVVERLTLERLYLHELGWRHAVADRSVLGDYAAGNLEYFSSGARIPPRLNSAALLTEFRHRLVDAGSVTTISTGIDRAGAALDLSPFDASLLWRHLVWTRRIDIDITLPLEQGMPLQIGGRSIADAISRELFGEVLS